MFFFKCVGIYTALMQEATISYQLLQSDSLQPFNVTKMNVLFLLLLLVGLASSVLISSNPNGAVISLYKETCCKSYNNGKAIKFGDDRLAFFFCPQNVEELCSPRSCKEVLYLNPNASSGYYYISLFNGSRIKNFCDMEGINCDQQGGWTRIAYLNTTQPEAVCPEGLRARSYGNLDHQLCSKIGNGGGCSSVYYSSLVNYTKVCGQVRGYHYGSPDGTAPYLGGGTIQNRTIDKLYVDGVSITYGINPRKHIWTYMGSLYEQTSSTTSYVCPCNTQYQQRNLPPAFIGHDYYCESGNHVPNEWYPPTFFPYDPLWDGKQCSVQEALCCNSTSMPWFIKFLNEESSFPIEIRLCRNEQFNNEDVPVEIIEILVK